MTAGAALEPQVGSAAAWPVSLRPFAPSPFLPGPSANQRPLSPPSQRAMASSQQAIAASASQQPIKGILKNKSSVACSLVPSTIQQRNKSVDELSKKSQKWDEMNIVATYYIEDEDLIKVHEPSTPENSMESDEGALCDSETIEVLNPEMLAKKLAAAKGSKPKYLVREQENNEDEDSDFSTEGKKSLLTTCCLFFFRCSVGNEQGGKKTRVHKISKRVSEKQLEFEMKRKLHDNEGLNLKLARQLISKELLELEEDEEISTTAAGKNMNMEESNQGSTTGDQLQNKSQSS